jgi:hypothetical protein
VAYDEWPSEEQIKGFFAHREIEIKIFSEGGNTNRQKVAKELVSILNVCDFKNRGRFK